MFAFDKAAGEPCQNLRAGHRCGIHKGLEQAGFKGCVQYGCNGAGQRVVQEVFNGESWQEKPALLAPMLEAFSQMRALHEQLALIKAAEGLALSAANRAHLEGFANSLLPTAHWTPATLQSFVRGPTLPELQKFWRSLQTEAIGQGAKD